MFHELLRQARRGDVVLADCRVGGQGDGTAGDTVTSGPTSNHFGEAEQPATDFIVTVDIVGEGGAVADGLDCFVTTRRDDRTVVDAEPHPL